MIEKEIWINEFCSTDRFKKICQLIDNIKIRSPIMLFDNKVIISNELKDITPREKQLLLRKVDLQPFYILDYISGKTDKPIYDIGCGLNFFKNFYNIIGIDSKTAYPDIEESFSKHFVKLNQEKLDNVFSINAIHFCNITDLRNRVLGFINLAKKRRICVLGY